MQSFIEALTNSTMYCSSSFIRGGEGSRNQSRFSGLGELEQSTGFHHEDAVNLSPGSFFGLKSNSVSVATNLQFGGLNTSVSSSDITSATGVDTGQYSFQKETMPVAASFGNVHFENWGDSGMVDNSQQADTSTDVDIDDKNQVYVQKLENSQLKLIQLEQELQRARQQGNFIANGYSGDQSHSVIGNGPLAFDMEYARWIDEHQRHINDLRVAVNSHVGDNELCLLVDNVMSHYDEIFRLKSIGAKSDVFHMLSGMWKTPAERCFMWLGGFRSSELLKILGNHLEPLTDQQLMGICNLQHSSQQAEDALSQGMEALQQSLADTLSSGALGPSGYGNVADYMGQMALAMGKLGTLENFLHQADLLRQQTLQQMHRILTTHQAAHALLVISDYLSRLRALSSLWLARPRD